MNTKLLREIKKAILAEPQRFIMDDWINTSDNTAPCGTAACIAGWATILTLQKEDRRKSWQTVAVEFITTRSTYSVEQVGVETLDLNKTGQKRLLFTVGWPAKFRKPFVMLSDAADLEEDLNKRLKLRKKMARIAANRIEHFIKHAK